LFLGGGKGVVSCAPHNQSDLQLFSGGKKKREGLGVSPRPRKRKKGGKGERLEHQINLKKGGGIFLGKKQRALPRKGKEKMKKKRNPPPSEMGEKKKTRRFLSGREDSTSVARKRKKKVRK